MVHTHRWLISPPLKTVLDWHLSPFAVCFVKVVWVELISHIYHSWMNLLIDRVVHNYIQHFPKVSMHFHSHNSVLLQGTGPHLGCFRLFTMCQWGTVQLLAWPTPPLWPLCSLPTASVVFLFSSNYRQNTLKMHLVQIPQKLHTCTCIASTTRK